MKNAILLACTFIVSAIMAPISIQAEEMEKAINTDPVVLINPFRVPKDKLEQTIQSWESARDFLSKQPGYISTKLHQSLAPDAQYL